MRTGQCVTSVCPPDLRCHGCDQKWKTYLLRGGRSGDTAPSVAELMRNLHLTGEEEEVIAFSDDEGDDELTPVVVLIGKVLSPLVVDATTIAGAVKPAWGNPPGLKIRSVREKDDNLFVAEFNNPRDMDQALGASPWLVGKHAVILQPYDGRLKPTDIKFDKMELWVRLLNLPLGWMNDKKGARIMDTIGHVIKMDVDRASGPFLRARVAIDIAKPFRRGIIMKVDRLKEPEWFDIQYEKLPFFLFFLWSNGAYEE